MLTDKPSINFHQWKVMDINVCDASLNIIYNLYDENNNNVEWEGVVKEAGTADFIGGYHGNEANQYLSVFIDGEDISLTEDFALCECNEIMIVNNSIVNRYDTPNDNLFKRTKVSTWNTKGYTIRNRWIALQNVKIEKAFLTMLSLPETVGDYEVASFGRYDDGFITQPRTGDAISGSCLYNSRYAKQVEFWGNDFYARCKAIYDDYSNYFVQCDRSQHNIFKAYYFLGAMDGGTNLNTNDELNGLSEYEFYF